MYVFAGKFFFNAKYVEIQFVMQYRAAMVKRSYMYNHIYNCMVLKVLNGHLSAGWKLCTNKGISVHNKDKTHGRVGRMADLGFRGLRFDTRARFKSSSTETSSLSQRTEVWREIHAMYHTFLHNKLFGCTRRLCLEL